MKKMSVFFRILLPGLAAFLLLPPLFYGIFQKTAKEQAMKYAEHELLSLQIQTQSLMDEYLGEGTVRDGEQIHKFLRAVSQRSRQSRGNARLLLFADGGSLIYPYVAEEKEAVSSLAETVRSYLSQYSDPENGDFSRITADGTDYLICIWASPVVSRRLQYIIVYSPVSQIGTWVGQAGQIVLLLSLALASILVLIFFYTAHSITGPLRRLSATAERISKKDYAAETVPFSIKEPEMLRISMNQMAEQLQKADAAQKTFFQTISHELRTPLMSISGYAQGIEQGVFPDSHAAARIILAESERLTGMVNELLTLSRLDGETADLPLEAVRLADEIGRAQLAISGAAQKKGVRLAPEPMDSEITVLGTDRLLSLILSNLLSNAVRHARAMVKVSAVVQREAVLVQIQDDGTGIAPEDMPHLFERGYKGAGGQFGVGLAIADSAAKQCHGRIDAGNVPQGGALFTVRLLNYSCQSAQ